MIETHPLAPFLPPDAVMLMLGSFPPPKERWSMNFYYPNLQNDMWRIFGLVFFNDAKHFLDETGNRFSEENIRKFLIEKRIALSDTAARVVRQKENASDKFLEVVETVDLTSLLHAIPNCKYIVTTGEKASSTLLNIFSAPKCPSVGGYVEVTYLNRILIWFRMPSSSRAYPLALPKKAAAYKNMFLYSGIYSPSPE